MSQDPKLLLEDGSIDASLRAELSAFGEQCEAQPFDMQAGLARFEHAIAALPASGSTPVPSAGVSSPSGNVAALSQAGSAGATAKTGLLAVGAAKGAAWIGGALLCAGVATWSLWPQSAPQTSTSPSATAAPAAPQPVQPPAVQVPPSKPQAQPSPVPDPATNALQAELAALHKARRALAKGQHARALSVLEQAQTDFPHGAVAPERQALMVIARFKVGPRSKAKRLARAFLQAHPNSPMAGRVRQLMRSTKR